MLKEPRKRKSGLATSLKYLLYAEVAAIGASYFLWHKMNTSRDFRHKMHKSFPSILNGYYYIGEKFGDYPTRILDYKAWEVSPPNK
ncbi:hypothetical protein ScPMuIL_014181 [Solemya velum]